MKYVEAGEGSRGAAAGTRSFARVLLPPMPRVQWVTEIEEEIQQSMVVE